MCIRLRNASFCVRLIRKTIVHCCLLCVFECSSFRNNTPRQVHIEMPHQLLKCRKHHERVVVRVAHKMQQDAARVNALHRRSVEEMTVGCAKYADLRDQVPTNQS